MPVMPDRVVVVSNKKFYILKITGPETYVDLAEVISIPSS